MSNFKRNISLVNSININTIEINTVIEMFLLAKNSELLSKNTIRLYEYQLNKLQQFMLSMNISLFCDLTEPVIQKYIAELAKTHKPRTCHITYRVIRTITYWFENFTDGDYQSPIHKMRAPKLPKDKKASCNIQQFQQLLRGCSGCNAKRDRAILMLAFDSGLRLSEMISLNVENVDSITGRIEVLTGKGNKYRVSFVSRPTLKAIRDYLKERGNIAQYEALFVSNYGNRLCEQGFQSFLNRVQKRAGIDIGGFHALRRGFAREFILNGGGIFQLQQIMGHEDISTTRSYVGLDDQDIEKAHHMASPINRMK